MSPAWKDAVNAAFELSGILWVGLNALDIWRRKTVAGQTLTASSAFTAWGLWNLYYYPSLGQWVSTAAGVGVLIVNVVMIALILRYRGNAPTIVFDMPDGSKKKELA